MNHALQIHRSPKSLIMAKKKVTSLSKNSVWCRNFCKLVLKEKNRPVMIERWGLCSIKRTQSVMFFTSGKPLGVSIFVPKWPQLMQNRAYRGSRRLNFLVGQLFCFFYRIFASLSEVNVRFEALVWGENPLEVGKTQIKDCNHNIWHVESTTQCEHEKMSHRFSLRLEFLQVAWKFCDDLRRQVLRYHLMLTRVVI